MKRFLGFLSLVVIFFNLNAWGDPPSITYSFEVSEAPIRINVVVAHDRGGYGDLASNLMMAHQLAEKYPKGQIRVILNPNDPHFQTLEPRLNPKLDSQKIGNIQFISSRSAIPQADYVMGFSRSHESMWEEISKSAPVGLSVTEYAGLADAGHGYYSDTMLSGISFPERNSPTLNYFSGVQHLGLYVSPSDPVFAQSREEFYESVKAGPAKGLPDYSPNRLLAVSYTRQPAVQKNYVNAIARAAQTPALQREEIVVMVPASVKMSPIELPPNVRLVSYGDLPLEQHMQLLMRSDLPPLVTGDASLTAAVQAGKMFFYEALAHKLESIQDIRKSLTSGIGRAGIDSTVNGAMRAQEEAMFEILSNPALNMALDYAVVGMRNESSMVDHLDKHLRVFSHFELPYLATLTAAELHHFGKLIIEEPSEDEIFKRLRWEATNGDPRSKRILEATRQGLNLPENIQHLSALPLRWMGTGRDLFKKFVEACKARTRGKQ